MRAVVILYCGDKLPDDVQSKLGSLVIEKANAFGEAKIMTLTDAEVEELTIKSVVRVAAHEAAPENDVIQKAIEIIKITTVISPTSDKHNECAIIGSLVKELQTNNEKEAIANAIKTLGLYGMPAILISRYGLSRQFVKAVQTLSKSNLV
jgi:hypothetical protein